MVRFVTGRKQAAIHKNILIFETLKAAKARRWTGKNIWRDVDTILFRVDLYKNTGVLLREQLMRDTQRRRLETRA